MTPEARVGLYFGEHPNDAIAFGKGGINGFLNTINPVNWAKGIYNTIVHPKQTFDGVVNSVKNTADVIQNGTSEEQFYLLGNLYGTEIGGFVLGEAGSVVGKAAKTKIINNKINRTTIRRNQMLDANTVELNPSEMAAKWQGNGTYPGVDKWTNIKIKKGSYVWGGTPGQTAFYTTTQDILETGNDASKIFQGLQVGISTEYHCYRPGMTMYRVPYDMDVAISQALANPQYGAGGLTQFFIPEYETLEPIQTLILKNR